MSIKTAQGIPGPITQGWPVAPSVFPTVVGTFKAKSKINDIIQTSLYGCAQIGIVIQMVGTNTSLQVQFEMSDNGGDWTIPYAFEQGQSSPNTSLTSAPSPYGVGDGPQIFSFVCPVAGSNFFRIRITQAATGTGYCIFRLTPSMGMGIMPVFLAAAFPTLSNNMLGIGNNVNFNMGTQAIQASQASAIVNGTITRTTITGLTNYKVMDFLLNITAGGTATGNLNIYLEDSVDGGTTWDDVVAFNTFALGSAVTTQRAVVQGALASSRASGPFVAQQIETLAAGTFRQGPFGDRIRVREVISGVSGSPAAATYRIDAVGHVF